jgi:spore coat protein U-like protein
MTTMFKKLSALGLLSLTAFAAQAGTATGTLTVQAQVAPKCTLGTAPTMDFGTYVQEGGDINATADIQLTCPSGTAVTIGLDQLSGGVRTMVGPQPTDALQYNLYKDSLRTQVWDNAGGGLFSYNYVAAGLQNHTVYGTILDNAANRLAPAGNYTQTIAITVTW